MGQIREKLRNLSLKASFILHVTICMLAATGISYAAIHATDVMKHRIYDSYEQDGDRYYLTTKEGERLGEGVMVLSTPALLSVGDNRKLAVLEGVSRAAVPIVFLIGITITAYLFYRSKLKKPLALLTDAANQIGHQNLDFALVYDRGDEMGRLCESFERMRMALRDNYEQMWRQSEERIRLHAAFSHDLRTPLTILKGQSDMLLKYVPDGKLAGEKVVSTVATMKSHIIRLEQYVEVMNRLQKLEDIETRKADVPTDEVINRLRTSGDILCAEKGLQLEVRPMLSDWVHVDLSFVMQVYENLLANAVRYAHDRICVTLSEEGGLVLSVSDDGPGFGDRDLLEATKPFYKSGSLPGDGHLGMGLHISSILCAKHGGYLRLSNRSGSGGATVHAVF